MATEVVAQRPAPPPPPMIVAGDDDSMMGIFVVLFLMVVGIGVALVRHAFHPTRPLGRFCDRFAVAFGAFCLGVSSAFLTGRRWCKLGAGAFQNQARAEEVGKGVRLRRIDSAFRSFFSRVSRRVSRSTFGSRFGAHFCGGMFGSSGYCWRGNGASLIKS